MKNLARSFVPGAFLLTAALALVACSSDKGSDEHNNGGGGSGGTGGDSNPGPCEGEPKNPEATCVESLDVSLIDEAGAPLEGITVFCCGTDICSAPVQTDAEGKAHIEVNGYMVSPAFKVLGAGKYISFAAPLPKDETKAVFPPTTLVAFPTEGTAFQPGTDQSLTSNGVTLEITAATEVVIDELSLPEAEDQLFKAVEIPLAKAPPTGSPEAGSLEAMFGLAPLATTFDPPAKLTLPNVKSWAAGSKIAVHAHGLEVGSDDAPYAGWGEVGEAVVAEDGKTLVMESGIPLLSTIGLRAKN